MIKDIFQTKAGEWPPPPLQSPPPPPPPPQSPQPRQLITSTKHKYIEDIYQMDKI